jgi:peptidoglycan/xylan/chitin deacetylase (PgdA/CDA1 family)
MLRARVKGLAELIAVRGGGRLVGRLRRRGQLLILSYHNVVPHGETARGDRSLHLSQRTFGDQLDELLRDHDVVPLAELQSAPSDDGRPRAAITFDDAYAGTLTAGIEELQRRGLPATVFVPPAFIGGRSFWWDELAEGFEGALPWELRERWLTELAGEEGRIRQWADSQGLPQVVALPPWARAGTEGDLRRAIARGRLSLGSHTWSHVNLAAVDPARRRDELVRSKEWLASRFPDAFIPWLSYPYGIESAEARAAASEAGYAASLRGAGGRFRPGMAPVQALPRLNVPAGLSPAGFALRVAGLLAR